MEMQSYTSPNPIGYGAEFDSSGQYVPNHFVTVPTQSRFAPLHEWVGNSMDVQEHGPGNYNGCRFEMKGDVSIQGVRLQVLIRLTFLSTESKNFKIN